jgi:exonuclease III
MSSVNLNANQHEDVKANVHDTHDTQYLLVLSGDVELNPGPENFSCKQIGIKLLTQNCRGLQDPKKVRYLLKNKNNEFKEGTVVLALQETHLMCDKFIKWSGNYVISSSASPHSAGCITYFNDFVKVVEVKHIDDEGHGHIVAVEGLEAQITIIANIYSPVRSLPREQEVFYNSLISLIDEMESKYVMREPSLIIMGDFNLPLESDLSLHNHNPAEVTRARTLRESLLSRGLTDCWNISDDRYTFRTGGTRLNRILYRLNKPYRDKLETIWTFTTSDHCLLKLTLYLDKEKCQKARITSLPTYLLDIKEAVNLINIKMFELAENCMDHWDSNVKLEYLKMSLRTSVGEVNKTYTKKQRDELEMIQRDIISRMERRKFLPLYAQDSNNTQLDLLFESRNIILEERSKKLAEKAKTKWFYEGEKANKYFLNLLKKRRSNVEIEKLCTDRGVITEENMINDEITNFYKNLYEDGGPSTPVTDIAYFEHIVKVTDSDATKVLAPLTKEELHLVLQTCDDSAPGPDGIPYSYYKQYWSYFGDVLVKVWNDSLESGILPDSHKKSILRLLPKVDKDLTKLTNWRPITLSNCDHKLITKCLARRLTLAVRKCLHPSQTAYLPGQQIQDNLRIIDIVNKNAPESLIVSLDARKAFDSVSHDYIRKVLGEFGLANFVPIFNLLYDCQKVNIAINGNLLEGYEIKNGVKQGDSLSCILFIMCMDPLIRNIENNDNIKRLEIDNIPIPKVIAYADDVSCIVDNSNESLQLIFTEYERLSVASGLILNANKTEILSLREQNYSINYKGEVHHLRGRSKVKINGVIFDKDEVTMQEDNFNYLMDRINKMLVGWSTRGLSLLGKILINKTYGLSQVVYVLSVVSLSIRQYRTINMAFNNFLWGRGLNSENSRSRISKERLNTPIEYSGFGMIPYEQVLEGIACRQLAKLYDNDFMHPLKLLTLKNNVHFAMGKSLTNIADEIATKAHNLITAHFVKQISKMSNLQITQDQILINLVGEIDIANMIKHRWKDSIETTRLVHFHGCKNIRDIISGGRITVQLSKKVLKAKFFRLVKAFWNVDAHCQEIFDEKIRLCNGKYKQLHQVSSKEFRELLQGDRRLTHPKIDLNMDLSDANDIYVVKSYLGTIKRLTNTRHKNTLLRIWNRDCLSRTRLLYMNLSETNLCPNCGMLDTPIHVLAECYRAQQVWQKLIVGVPKNPSIELIDYALGISDSATILAIKAETLKMLMHLRDLEANAILMRVKNYFLTIQGLNTKVKEIFERIT